MNEANPIVWGEIPGAGVSARLEKPHSVTGTAPAGLAGKGSPADGAPAPFLTCSA